MLIVLQFPFADLRPFGDADDDTRVPISTSFSQKDLADTRDFGGTERPPFLPSVGPLRKRRQGVRYGGESLYFNGRRALRFADRFRTIPDPRGGGPPIQIDLFFRRFQAYRDDHQLAKYELALLLDLGQGPPLDGTAVRSLLASCLTIPVVVPPQKTPVPLVAAGPHLAAALLRDTTSRRAPTPPAWTMAAGAPVALVEYGTAEVAGTPPGRQVTLAEAQDLALNVYGSTIGGVPLTTWFLSTGPDAVARPWLSSDQVTGTRDLARQLRINLLRHHAEREALTYALQCVRERLLSVRGPDLAHTELRDYFVRAAARLTREQRFSLAQRPITEGLDAMEVAAGFVDRSDSSRYTQAWEQLAQVLDEDLFVRLSDALHDLPMGTGRETANLRALLRENQKPPRKLAISYAHEDERIKESFSAHLADAEKYGMVAAWDDRWIPAGSDWKQEIDRRFLEADIVVPLVSPDFLASRYCMEVEMPLVFDRATRGELALVPVIVRKCEWQPSIFGKVQGVPMDEMGIVARGNRAAAWRIVIHRILTARTGLP